MNITKATLSRLILSFEKEFNNIGAKKAVIGLSGGIDSALAAATAIKAIGKDNVLLYYLPYKTSSINSLNDAKKFCDTYNANLNIIEITEIADLFFKLNNVNDNLRKGNIMSRCRMVILFDKAKEYNGIVIGTTNKTELLLGYGTWYGDTASSINVLGNLYKKDVVALSKEIGIPESIISKPPTADLWQGQTDEEELGFSYNQADTFFYSAIELGIDKIKLYEIFGEKFVKKISKRVINNTFKRNLPIICNVYNNSLTFNEINEILKKTI